MLSNHISYRSVVRKTVVNKYPEQHDLLDFQEERFRPDVGLTLSLRSNVQNSLLPDSILPVGV